MILSREDILNKTELPRQLVEMPEWGGDIYVRVLTGNERDEWEGALIELRKDTARKRGGGKLRPGDVKVLYKGARARLVAAAACDEHGNAIFTLADADALGNLNSVALNRAYEAAQSINKMTEDDTEELLGNSDETPESASG